KQVLIHSFLAGHVSDEQMTSIAIVSKPVSIEQSVEQHLENVLPHYMVPKIYITIESLPLTANGKVDRNALPAPDGTKLNQQLDFVLPQSEIEVILADIIKEVVKITDIGINHNFFELGANSVGIVQINALLQQRHNIVIPIVYMFQYPTISFLASYLAKETEEEKSYDDIKDRAQKRKSRRRKPGTGNDSNEGQ
ncbi:hypothetical protein MNBD_GAMMA12-2514, partial [hydrothermal vent metagenome]